jgi:hypothetical protein
MAFVTVCEGCQAGVHSRHIDVPAPLLRDNYDDAMCGGGFCPCQGQCEKVGGLSKEGDIFKQLKEADNG